MTPADLRRIPWAIATGEGTWVCPNDGKLVFRDQEGRAVSVIPLKDRILVGHFVVGDERVTVLDYRLSAPPRSRPLVARNIGTWVVSDMKWPQTRARGGTGEWLVSRCERRGCRVKVRELLGARVG